MTQCCDLTDDQLSALMKSIFSILNSTASILLLCYRISS